MTDYWKLKIRKYKDSTGNWQTTITGGYLDITGIVNPMTKYKDPDYINDNKLNNGYWKVTAELTNLINPFTNPITNVEVKETKIEVSYEDIYGWEHITDTKTYSQYLAMGAAEKIQKRYKELFGVDIVLDTIFVKGEAPETTTATASTPETNEPVKVTTETPPTQGSTNSVFPDEPKIYGEFTFNVEDEYIFRGLDFGKLEIISKGILKDEVTYFPDEILDAGELDEEYIESDFQGLEEAEMEFETAEYTLVGFDELEYATPPLNNTGSSNGSGMSESEWNKNGTVVIGSKVPSDLSGPVKYNQKITINKTMKDEYIPTIKKMKGYPNGLKLLAMIMAIKEGFEKGTRSYRTNNPGNIGNTDSGSNRVIKNLEEGIKLQLDYIKKVANGSHKGYPLNKEKYIKPYYSPEIAKNNGPGGPYRGMTEYLPGYKFTYTGAIEQYVKIYATGARSGNSYTSMIVSWFRENGYSWVNEETTIAQLIEQNKKDVGVFA